ncbi:hypothetical protein LINGRAHAP2_LOCUS14138, partial [Linum grandiflorum]
MSRLPSSTASISICISSIYLFHLASRHSQFSKCNRSCKHFIAFLLLFGTANSNRLRWNQEGDLPQTSVEEEQVADADAGHGGGSSSNLAGEVAPPQSVPSVGLGGVLNQIREENRNMMLKSRRQILEENQEMMLENHRQMMEENRKIMEENRKIMEKDCQLMVETRQIIDNRFDRLCSNMDRRMDQLFEAVNENQKSFDEVKRVLKPIAHSMVLPNDGIGLTSKSASGGTIFPLDRGQAAKPWQGSLPPPMTRQPPLKHGGNGEDIVSTFTTHVEKTDILKDVLKARPHMTSPH